MSRPLYCIANDIRRAWPKPNFAADPYLRAMRELHSVSESYYADSGESVVRYFLANAATFRGEKARALKAELKALLPEAK
jgi:hypothetical protein